MRFAVSKTASGAKLKLQNRGGRNKPTRRMASSFYWHAAGKDPTGLRTIAMQGTAWLTRKLYTELYIGDFSILGVRKWLFLLVGAPRFELGPERINRDVLEFIRS